jgi:hypothetical protein
MKSGTYEYQTELFRQWIAQSREEGESEPALRPTVRKTGKRGRSLGVSKPRSKR